MSKPRKKKKSPKRGLRLLPRVCRDSSRTRRRIGRHPALRARSPIHVGGLSPFGLWPLGSWSRTHDSFFQRAKRYDTDMDLKEIQHAIETLSSEQQIALLGWLAERDRRQWDSQIERDFSPDGAGMELLNQVKAQIRRGESVRMGNGR